MGKYKAIISFALAVVLALGSSAIIYKWMRNNVSQPRELKAVVQDTVGVAIAATNLSVGAQLVPEMIAVAQYPKKFVPADCFSDPASLKGRVVICPLKPNEPIMESKLAPSSVSRGGMCAVLSPGKRALAVPGDKIVGLAGLIRPGDRVDILVAVKLKPYELDSKFKTSGPDSISVAKIVLEDVPVLATGTVMDSSTDPSKPGPVDVYTVEVTPEEGERLTLAASNGKLQFALRNVTDKETVYTMGVTASDMLDAYRPRLKPVTEAPVVQPVEGNRKEVQAVRHIEVIKGSNVSNASF